eukprot:CAMPEP_0117447290 /NCGR_PEP_ID=MMETSP0759-20121206/6793_1 /TAXON_ID=63605 /ORGANISM="Percolomonas cosmopolitus, Strain WS" /LENGTH=868 /DNA_ID=CAMNT_0005239609 /DNA_START=101 /DNA_END=2707 /DNA_ORIENTATION=-
MAFRSSSSSSASFTASVDAPAATLLNYPETLSFNPFQAPPTNLLALTSLQAPSLTQILPISHAPQFLSHLISFNDTELWFVAVDEQDRLKSLITHQITTDPMGDTLALCHQFPLMMKTEPNGLILLYFYVKVTVGDDATAPEEECVLFVWDENDSSGVGYDAHKVSKDQSLFIRHVWPNQKYHKLWAIALREDLRSEERYLVAEAEFSYVGRGNNKYDTVVKRDDDSVMYFQEYQLPIVFHGDTQRDWTSFFLKIDDTWNMATIHFVDGDEEAFSRKELTIEDMLPDDQKTASFDDYPFVFATSDSPPQLVMSDGLEHVFKVHTFNHEVTQTELSESFFVDNSTMIFKSLKEEKTIVYKCSPSSCAELTRAVEDEEAEIPISFSTDAAFYHADFTWNFFTHYDPLTNQELDSLQFFHVTQDKEVLTYNLKGNLSSPKNLIEDQDVKYLFSVGHGVVLKSNTDESAYFLVHPSNTRSSELVTTNLTIPNKKVLSVFPHPDHTSIIVVAKSDNDDVFIHYTSVSFAQGCSPACNTYGTRGSCNLATLQCDCLPGFEGDNCFDCQEADMIGVQCNFLCNDTNCLHGQCNEDKGLCECFSDIINGFWKDADSGNLHCSVCQTSHFDENDNCTSCREGWTNGVSDLCEVPVCFGIAGNNVSTVCAGHGSCSAPNRCECDQSAFAVDFWSGIDCSKATCFGYPADNPNACHGNGLCTGWNICECNSGFFGLDCDTFQPTRSTGLLIGIAAALGGTQLILIAGLILYTCGSYIRGGVSPSRGGRKFSVISGRRPVNLDIFSDGELLIDEEEDNLDNDFLRNEDLVEENQAESENQKQGQFDDEPEKKPTARPDASLDEDFGLNTDSDDDSQLILV